MRIAPPVPGTIAWTNKQALLVAIKHEDNYTLYFLGDETAPRIVAEIKSDESGTTYSHYFGTQTPVERLLALAQLHESTPSAASPTSEIVRGPNKEIVRIAETLN